MRIKLGLVVTAFMVAACSGSDPDQLGGAGAGGPNRPGPTGPGTTEPTPGEPVPGEPAPKPPEKNAPLAQGITVAEVAVFQAVKVSVAKAGAKVTTRAAQVVAGRDALVRVYVTPDGNAAGKALTAELKVSGAGGEQLYKDAKSLTRASTDDALASTFNFEVPGAVLGVGAQYSVAVTDPSLPGVRGTESSTARYPADGSLEAFDAKSTGKQLKVQLVPFQYNADGSGRLADTSPAQVERYRQGFFKMYPVAAVDVTVHAPVAWSTAISAGGSGFSTALQAMVRLRQQDGAPADLYYMGIFSPAPSLSQYCQGGCVMGLSGLISDPRDSAGRASVGVGFAGDQSVATAVHEVGHAHGRSHAPCGGAAGADRSFPYAGGGIGSWGYDLVSKQLLPPTRFKDFMGYCSPEWISDYNYNAIFRRVQAVNGVPTTALRFTEPRDFRIVSVEPDGRLVWGDAVTLRESPVNEPRTVRYVAADGAIETATGFYYPYDDMDGGYMLVPASARPFMKMEVLGLPARFAAELAAPAR